MTKTQSETRSRLVETARGLFHSQGYASTGVAQILRESGTNSGSLYYYFPTKEDLLVAVLEWYRDHIGDDLIDLHTGHIDDPVEKVFGLLDGYRQMLLLFDFELGCPIGALALELANSHPTARSLALVNFEQWINTVEGFFRKAIDRFPEGTDPRALSVHVLTVMEGAMMLARTYRSATYFDQAVTQLRLAVEARMTLGTEWSAPRRAGAIQEAL